MMWRVAIHRPAAVGLRLPRSRGMWAAFLDSTWTKKTVVQDAAERMKKHDGIIVKFNELSVFEVVRLSNCRSPQNLGYVTFKMFIMLCFTVFIKKVFLAP